MLVGPGDDLTVLDGSGTVTRGKLSAIAAEELLLDVGGAVRRWRETDVREIRFRMKDSILNGVLIGAAIGAALGSLYYLDNECRGDPACAAAVAQGAAVGAGTGWLIDAIIRPSRLIYERSPSLATRFIRPTFSGPTWRVGMQRSVRF